MRDKDELLKILEEYGVKSGAKMYAKGQEKLRLIIEEAISLLDEQGSKGFTMRALARRADIPLSVLQHYFRTRDDVLEALVVFFRQSLTYEVKECFSDTEAPFEWQVRSYIKSAVDYSRYAGLGHTLFSECQTISKPLAPLVEAAYQEALELIENAYAKARPELKREERLRRVAFLLATLEGLTIFLSDQPSMAPSPEGLAKASEAYLLKILLE